MPRILASDILIADVIVDLKDNPQLQKLVDKYHLKPGGKGVLTKEQFDEFGQTIEGRPITIMPGGSAANMLTTMGKLLGDKLETDFIGITGEGMYSNMIKHSLDEANVKLAPIDMPPGKTPQTAVSYVIRFPGGERSIVTYPGNAREIIRPEMPTEELVKKSDIVLVQGSLWHKLDRGFADKLLDERWKHDKELWLTLPTQAKFAEDNGKTFQWLIASADVVMSNEEELMRIYHTLDLKAALENLREDLSKSKAVKTREGKTVRHDPVAFVTQGKDGAMLVTPDGIEHIEASAIKKEDIINTLGAGDTSYAGFASGYLLGLSNKTSGQLGMVLAGEKLKHNGARLADPAKSLAEGAPMLAREVFAKIEDKKIVNSR